MPNIFLRAGCFLHFLKIQLLIWRELCIHLYLQQVIQRDPCSVTIRIPPVAFETTAVSLFATDTLVSKPWNYPSVLHLYHFIISRMLYRIRKYGTYGFLFLFFHSACCHRSFWNIFFIPGSVGKDGISPWLLIFSGIPDRPWPCLALSLTLPTIQGRNETTITRLGMRRHKPWIVYHCWVDGDKRFSCYLVPPTLGFLNILSSIL